jgi:uncharacterized protein (TIGR02145 family)
MKTSGKYYTIKGSFILNVILSVLLFMTCTGNLYSQRISIDGNKFRVYGKEIFINGVNTPWDHWNDFGGNYDPNFWDAEFQKIRQAGGNASRIWITCNGDVGINISETGLVSSATAAHWSNLDNMFALAAKHKVYIMATLISFDHTKNTYVKYQRWRNMLADTANVSSYVNNYVVPFINRYKNNPYLWCIDVCNEIEWMHETAECGNISWNTLQYFVARVATAVHKNSIVPVTLGSAAVKWNSDCAGCEGNFWSDQNLQAQYNSPEAFLDFYSPHFYGWVVRWFGNFAADRTPTSYGINDRPSMVGENPARGVYKQNTSGQDELVIPISEAYIKTYQQGWKGLMVWTSNGVDGNGNLTNCGVGLTAFKNRYPELVSPGPTVPEQFDSIIDTRDGQVYRIVKIGSQWWMQENLNIGTRIDGTTDAADNDSIEKYCYNDLETNCDIYGGLYQWNEMMDYNPSDNGAVGTTRGICPLYWHIPSDEEWKVLEQALGMTQVEADKLNAWRGSDEGYQLKSGSTSGFEAMFAGNMLSGIYSGEGTDGLFWASGETDNLHSYYRKISSDYTGIFRGYYPKNSGFSVRCVKDPCLLTGITLSKTDITCHGNSDGSVNLSVTGTGQMKYKWSTGDTIQNIQNLDKGWYSVEVSDSMGCTITDSIEIPEPPEIQIVAIKENVSCSGNSDGSITSNISGGTPPYSCYWNDGLTTCDRTGLLAGSYTLVVTDDNGCINDTTIGIQEPLILAIDSIDLAWNSISQTFSITIHVSGGTEPYTYRLTNVIENTDSSNLTGEFNDLLCGEYEINVSDKNSCTDSADFSEFPKILCLDVEPIKDESSIYLYPNPTTGKITVEIENQDNTDIKLEILNILGQVIWTKDLKDNGEPMFIEVIDLSRQSKGIYFMRVNGLPFDTRILLE